MSVIKYIYFETTKVTGGESSMQNINALMFKPEGLNSHGVRSYRNLTDRSGKLGDIETKKYIDVTQYWVDVPIFKKACKSKDAGEFFKRIEPLVDDAFLELAKKFIKDHEL